MHANAIWSMIDAQRRAIADLFAGLPAEQWAVGSLCAGWTVRDVAAHLTLQSMSVGATLRVAVRHPGGLNHVIDASSRHRARTWSTTAIVDALHGLVGVHRPNAFTSPHDTLVDSVVHRFDAAVPLGLPLTVDRSTTIAVLDALIGYRGTRNAAVFDALPLDGLRLDASDMDWTWGTGPTVSAPSGALILVAAGRAAGLDDATGPGAAVLHRRLADRM